MYPTSRSTIAFAKSYHSPTRRRPRRPHTAAARPHRRRFLLLLAATLTAVTISAAVAARAAAIPDPFVPYPPQASVQACTEAGWASAGYPMGLVCGAVDALWTFIRISFSAGGRVYL